MVRTVLVLLSVIELGIPIGAADLPPNQIRVPALSGFRGDTAPGLSLEYLGRTHWFAFEFGPVPGISSAFQLSNLHKGGPDTDRWDNDGRHKVELRELVGHGQRQIVKPGDQVRLLGCMYEFSRHEDTDDGEFIILARVGRLLGDPHAIVLVDSSVSFDSHVTFNEKHGHTARANNIQVDSFGAASCDLTVELQNIEPPITTFKGIQKNDLVPIVADWFRIVDIVPKSNKTAAYVVIDSVAFAHRDASVKCNLIQMPACRLTNADLLNVECGPDGIQTGPILGFNISMRAAWFKQLPITVEYPWVGPTQRFRWGLFDYERFPRQIYVEGEPRDYGTRCQFRCVLDRPFRPQLSRRDQVPLCVPLFDETDQRGKLIVGQQSATLRFRRSTIDAETLTCELRSGSKTTTSKLAVGEDLAIDRLQLRLLAIHTNPEIPTLDNHPIVPFAEFAHWVIDDNR